MIDDGLGTESVECDEIVYRALKRPWAQDERIAPEAFIRRIPGVEAEAAVSMSRRKYVTARECRMKLKRMPATASLHVGKIRELPFGLEVSPDPDRDEHGTIIDPGHCLLMNLPDPITDYESAEFTASQLTKIARLVTPNQEEDEHQERTRKAP